MLDSKKTNRVVFLFITLGFAFLVAFTSLILINNKTFVDKVYYRTVVDNAKGLSAKPPIYFKGLEIGRVASFSLNNMSNDIEVAFYVFAEYQNKIVPYAVLSGNQSVLLDRATEFELLMPERGKVANDATLAPGALVPFITSKVAQSYISKGIIRIPADSIDAIITSVNNLLVNLQRSDNPESGAIFRILDRAAKMSDHLLVLTESLSQTNAVSEIEQILTKINRILTELPQTQDKFDRVVSDASDLMAQMQGILNQYQDPAGIMTEFSDGQVPVILKNVNDSIVTLKGMIDDVHAEKMQLIITVNTLLKVLNKMDKTLQGVNNNPLLKGGIEKTTPPKGIEMNE